MKRRFLRISITIAAAMTVAVFCGAGAFAAGPSVTVDKTGDKYTVNYSGDSASKGKLINVFAYRGELDSEQDGASIKDDGFLDGETATIGNDGKFSVDLKMDTKEGAVIYLGGEDSLLPGGKSPYLVQARIPAVPKGVTASSTGYDSIRISWNKVTGASRYRVFCSENEADLGKGDPIATVSAATFEHKGLITDKNYYYAVQAYDEKLSGDLSSSVKAAPKLSTTVSKLALTKRTYDQVLVSWTKVAGADGYYIYRTTNQKNWPQKASVTDKSGSSVSYTDGSRATGTLVYYRVQAYRNMDGGKVSVGPSSLPKSIRPYLKTTKLKSAKAKKKTVTLKWNKVAGASGYYIYRAAKKNKSYKKIAVVKGGGKVSYKNNKLKKGKYFYKVRPYRTVNGKAVFASYSNYKNVKVK